jgi:hypothetical protein
LLPDNFRDDWAESALGENHSNGALAMNGIDAGCECRNLYQADEREVETKFSQRLAGGENQQRKERPEGHVNAGNNDYAMPAPVGKEVRRRIPLENNEQERHAQNNQTDAKVHEERGNALWYTRRRHFGLYL